jgi:molybdenum cofactor cytidylyltransferase
MNPIGVILLAAGGSTRMGRPKQLLPYRGTTLLRHAAQVAIESGLGPVVVVLGAEEARCRAELENLPLTIAGNPRWSEGMGGSIALGVETLLEVTPEVLAALIMHHDQPLVSAARLQDLARPWSPPEALVVASAYGNTFGVPALFDRTLFPRLRALSGARGAHPILQEHAGHLVKVALPEAAQDIDSPVDYQRLSDLESRSSEK